MAWWEGANETCVLIAQDLSTRGKHLGKFLSLRHPRTGNTTCYLYNDGGLQELHWFKQSYGSWFLGDYVCEDGRLYTATPVDPVFILLPIFEEARMKSLSSIVEKTMHVVCDLKEVGSTKFFRLNDLKVLKWLCYKLNLQDWTKAQDTKTLPPSTGSGPASFNPVQENNGIDKEVARNTRQAKKARVEKDTQNIKDMFSRVTRKKG
ncbi:Ribonuclease H2 subunit B [Sesamum angolense]|uniref:Ribonuclease H2 subunit B n=1 Tax=Sesamum angolense TaxID=2727404 RepID=A0AAE1X849_9LAMI|nr:Ribonuclease H2 subunit B [Sesamum angolense]